MTPGKIAELRYWALMYLRPDKREQVEALCDELVDLRERYTITEEWRRKHLDELHKVRAKLVVAESVVAIVS